MELHRVPVTDRDVTCRLMVEMIGAVFTVLGVKAKMFSEPEDTEKSLVKAGSAALEYVVRLKMYLV